jgi:hypothetical protein
MRKFLLKFFLGLSLMPVELTHISPLAIAATATGSTDHGKPVMNQSELVGTWSLASVSLDDPKIGSVSFSGQSYLRFRVDGVVMAEFLNYSLSFSDQAVYGDCTGYETGSFSIAGDSFIRADTMIVGLTGYCYGAKISPAVKTRQDQKLRSIIRGSILTISGDVTVTQKGVTRHITIRNTYIRKTKDTWDGSGVDPALVGRYRLTGMYTDSSCKGAPMNEFKGELPTSGSWTFEATTKSYISKQEAFRIGPSEPFACTTKGQMTGDRLSIKWTQDSSSDECMASDSSDNDKIQYERDIMGLPSRNYVTIMMAKFPDKDCDDGFSYRTLISVFTRY